MLSSQLNAINIGTRFYCLMLSERELTLLPLPSVIYEQFLKVAQLAQEKSNAQFQLIQFNINKIRF